MPTWDASQYLRFADERTQPCRDLATRVSALDPKRVIDLGCGPGNSTSVIARKWPNAQISGLDSSLAMIDAARRESPHRTWLVDDVENWAANETNHFDVVFSNAAMQWVNNHATVFPQLINRVSTGGALAVQMPCNYDAPAHLLMRSLAASESWRNYFPSGNVREWHVHPPAFYYDTLAPHTCRIDLWQTEYLHVLPSAAVIVEWYKGTGLRPFLDALPNDAEKNKFTAEYLELIKPAYPPQPDGNVLFPFRRLFIVAYR